MSLRALQRRVKRIEEPQKPRPSPFVIICGSFDAFADATYTEVETGTLGGDWLPILDILRAWEDGGVWVLAYAR